MNAYSANECRLCFKVFCCKECRTLHEEQSHQVNPECEICIYGRTTIKQASVSLLNHIKSKHWPLHCVFCKKVFNSFDELVPHDKCTVAMENFKVQKTPNTPVTPLTLHSASIVVTPFYKDIPGTHLAGNTILIGATSTPLHNEEQKITPNNNTNIQLIYKSNLKLTGSGSLSDSKKSERRVTFCETPSFSDHAKRQKTLPLVKREVRTIHLEETNKSDESEDESYTSISNQENYNIPSPPIPTDCEESEEKENVNHKLTPSKRYDSNTTLWQSALTNLEFYNSNVEILDNTTNNYNVALQINVFNESVQTSPEVTVDIANVSTNNKNTSIWSSMTNIVKSVVHNISLTAQTSFSAVSIKRACPDNDVIIEAPVKRMKFTDIKCRRSIRELGPYYQMRYVKPRGIDKATQTEVTLML